MEVQNCAFESPTITNSNYYYGKINIGSVIMCFLIIYSTAISIVLSVKQFIQVIKEEELIKEMEDGEVKVDVQTQVIKEVVKEVVKVDVQTQVEEEKDDSEDDSEDEDELLLANYRIKEREQALQEIYKERAEQAVEKWKEAYSNMINYNVNNLLLQFLLSSNSGNTQGRLNGWFNKNTEYVDGKAQSTSLKAAMNMIYRLETEEHLVKVEALARAEAVYAFKKIQFHIHFDFAFDDWPRVLKEEYYPQDALDIIKINKQHKLMTHL